MGIISSNKLTDASVIGCGGDLNVTIGITAAPNIQTNPTDIVLILDRSGSMSGQPLADMKTAVGAFIDIIATATDGTADQIGSGSRIGIVSFADTAVQNAGLITSVSDLKAAANALNAGGFTNHGDAFTEATDLLSGSTRNRVMVMFTDGETTTGPAPSPIAAAARAQGVTIYCIGLVGSSGIDVNALNDWATDPDSTHVAVAPDSSELEQLFADLAANIAIPGATDIVIDELINPDFVITGTPVASVGSITGLTDTAFRWAIDQLGTAATESATVTFPIQHIATTTGQKQVNDSITYADTEGNTVTFADPSVFVDCTQTVIGDFCPPPVDIAIDGCQDFVEFDAGDLILEDAGRILQLDVNLLGVCPGKRVALAVVLTELDQNGDAQPRGMKTYALPAHSFPNCTDVLVRCVRFILPESLNASGGGMCAERSLRAQFFAHYIDNDYQCCPGTTVA